MGREGKGGQAWLTDWLSPKEYIQLGYRNAKVSKTFIPGGTTQNDINIRAVLRLKENLELNAFGQAEFWKVPALASGTTARFHRVDPADLLSQTELAQLKLRKKNAGRGDLRSGCLCKAICACRDICWSRRSRSCA